MDISLPFGKFFSFQSLISQKQLREINLQMVSTISFGWFADFRKTLTIIFNGLPNWSTLTNGKHPLFTCCSLAILPYWTASKIYRQGKYVIRHTCLADNFEKKPMWIPGERWSVCNPLAELWKMLWESDHTQRLSPFWWSTCKSQFVWTIKTVVDESLGGFVILMKHN